MSGPIQFPRRPAMRRDDPFVGRDGRNPFADPSVETAPGAAADQAGEPAAESAAESAGNSSEGQATGRSGSVSDQNVFTAPADAATLDRRPAYRPDGYETTLPHRGGVILVLGIVGLTLSLLGCLGGLAGWTGAFDLQSTLFLLGLGPLAFLSLGSSLPAFILASQDLRAMRAGAMESSGKTRTRVGYWLGFTSMLISSVLIALVMLGLIWLFLGETA